MKKNFELTMDEDDESFSANTFAFSAAVFGLFINNKAKSAEGGAKGCTEWFVDMKIEFVDVNFSISGSSRSPWTFAVFAWAIRVGLPPFPELEVVWSSGVCVVN